MFRFHKTLDIVTLFHKASSPSSIRVANLLKQASASASAYATEDQAAQTTTPTHANHGRDPFELNITEELPTEDQVQTILKYAGPRGLPTIIRGARDEKDALKKYKENKENFLRPVIVDWNNGKVLAGDNDSEILKMLHASKE